jgi:hypothetical protein
MSDPPRLLESPDTPEALKDALEGARADVPVPARMAAIGAKLGGGGGGTPLALKGGIAVAIGAGVVAASVAVVQTTNAPPPSTLQPVGPSVQVVLPPPPPASTPSVVPSAAPPPKPSAAPPIDPADEINLLKRAQDALSSSPAQTIALCNDHAKKFPRSAFAQERELLVIDAMNRSGQREAAIERAKRFAAAYPGSAHVRRLETMLGTSL